MPLYQYRCQQCGFEKEELQKMDSAPLVQCEACHQDSLVKCMTAPAMRLTGNGYYETCEKPKDKQRHIARADDD